MHALVCPCLRMQATSYSSARLSRGSLIELRCPALWTMSPFQISRRPIEDNYNLGDTEEHYSSKPSCPLRPAVFPVQFLNTAFNSPVGLTHEAVHDINSSPTKHRRNSTSDCKISNYLIIHKSENNVCKPNPPLFSSKHK